MQVSELLGLFRRRGRSPERAGLTRVERLERDTAAAREDIRRKWARYCITVRPGADLPLVDRMDRFVELMQRYLGHKHPVLLDGSAHAFWFAVFAAILESGTHPREDVRAAIETLRRRYRGPPSG